MNTLTFPILRLLADGKFHSGETIAKALNVSRATVWNAIQHALNLDVEVFSVRGKGYKLPQAITWLDATNIQQALGEPAKNLRLEVHDYLDSTNSYLMKKVAAAEAHGTCVVANLQTSGRGRRGRSWQAGLGASLTFSLLWRFQCGAAALSGLSLAVGVAIIRALHSLGVTAAQLKWPNDVLINQEKLAGILIELQGDMEGPSAAVIGVGINLNLPKRLKESIDQPATDLANSSAAVINPNVLLGATLTHLVEVLSQFEQHGFTSLREEWTSHHAYQQQRVTMLHPNSTASTGTVLDVADDGILLVQTTEGVQRFASGEISLRSANLR